MSLLTKDFSQTEQAPARKNLGRYLLRWFQVTSLAGIVGGMTALVSSSRTTSSESLEYIRQSTLIRSDPAEFAIRRSNVQKNMSTKVIANGLKYSMFAGVFSFFQLGLTYARGYWDPWNTLVAGTASGTLCGGFLGGLKGMKSGFVFGSLLAVPFCMFESAIRIYVHDDDLLPYKPVLSDNAESLNTFMKDQAVLKNPQLYKSKSEEKDE